MSNIKLKGATSGESIIKAPAEAGSDTTITLPKTSIDFSTAGSDGQFLKTDGAGTLSFDDVSAGTALTGSTDNTVCTVTGANAIQGEANLTFDGNHLTQTIDANAEGFNQTAAGAHYIDNTAEANLSSGDNPILRTTATWNGTTVAQIKYMAGTDTTNKDDGYITFNTSSADNLSEKMRIQSDGDVKINDGNLIVGTAGHGIDFSATGDSTGTMSNELLDDYEEGTWDPVLYSTGGGDDFGFSSRAGYYQKVGGVVHYYCNIQWTKGAGVSAGYVYCKGFPFTTRNNPGSYYYIGANMNVGGLDANRPFVLFNANGNNTIGLYNTGGATGLTGFCETGDIGSSGSSWFSLTVFTDA